MGPETLVPQRFFIVDVESIGLHGDGFAVGYVVVDRDGNEEDSGLFTATTESATGTASDHAWVQANVMPALISYMSKRHALLDAACIQPVRAKFWDMWIYWKGQGAWMAADIPWPVEANFLRACVADSPRLAAHAPYPLIDIASVRFAAGLDPLASAPRQDDELPRHNPLADARQSARLLIEALKKLELLRDARKT